ncbi:PadR family transcriptional regulator [Kineococcus glutinatus]|uniref:PadR family transcriptional regulator n=1 Tax=Kineococcus glutinatus TaxID=1070872 RepID=A0ABP9H998_9ACTN
MAQARKVANPLGLAVLAYLTQRPMHPYELGRTLRDNGDARSIKFNHGSLYTVVGQLQRAGYVEEAGTSRSGQRPERTVYAITDAGRREVDGWIRELLAEPQHEYPAFTAALSLVAVLPPADVLPLLRRRLDLLAAQRTAIRELVDTALAQGVPALFLLEEEHRLALLDAEVAFVERLCDRIADPQEDWARQWTSHREEAPPDER